jgi:hypothetical protein
LEKLFSIPAGCDVQQNYNEIAENFYLQNEKKTFEVAACCTSESKCSNQFASTSSFELL